MKLVQMIWFNLLAIV